MAVFKIFSKRQKEIRGESPDILVYDELPEKLRVQIIHIIEDVIGSPERGFEDEPSKIYKAVNDILCREHGYSRLGDRYSTTYKQDVLNFFKDTKNVEHALDVVELCFVYIDKYIREMWDYYSKTVNVKMNSDEAIEELNIRFKESGIGYAFEGGKIIRLDSTYIHSEIVKPTISLLVDNDFKGANEEYMKAHDHYRQGKNKECLAECLKAFESAMKTICENKGWKYNPDDSSKKLIEILFTNKLVPSYTQNQFTSLRNLLESGIPTLRNKLGGHGQGKNPVQVDSEITRFGLNLTGTCLIFIIEQSKI